MNELDKSGERSMLVLLFGRFLAPIYDLAEKASPPSSMEYRVARAKMGPEISRLDTVVRRFCEVEGVLFDDQVKRISGQIRAIHFQLENSENLARTDPSHAQKPIRDVLNTLVPVTLSGIDEVPIAIEPLILREMTPLSSFFAISDAMKKAKRRLHYFDRYLSSDFFELYLRSLGRALEIRLITTKGNPQYGVTAVHAISRLADQEFSNYQLIECSHQVMHDRNLRIDETVYFLGPSLDGAGRYPTNFAPADSSPNAHIILDEIIAKGHRVL